MKTKTLLPVQLNFRNENYGFVYRSAAFRFGYLGEFSETRRSRILAKARKQGFVYSHLRESWIKEDVSDPAAEAQKLVTALAEAGYDVATNQFFPGLNPARPTSATESSVAL